MMKIMVLMVIMTNISKGYSKKGNKYVVVTNQIYTFRAIRHIYIYIYICVPIIADVTCMQQ